MTVFILNGLPFPLPPFTLWLQIFIFILAYQSLAVLTRYVWIWVKKYTISRVQTGGALNRKASQK